MKVGQVLHTGLIPAKMEQDGHKTHEALKSHAVLRDTQGIWQTWVLQKTYHIPLSSKIQFPANHSWAQKTSMS